MPFVTEELWQNLPRRSIPAGQPTLLALAPWPQTDHRLVDQEAEDQFPRVQEMVAAVRTIRAEYGVDPGKMIPAILTPATPATVQAFNAEQHTAQRLARVNAWTVNDNHAVVKVSASVVLKDGSSVTVPLGDAIDVKKECGRLGEELDRLDRQLANLAATLANERFVSRAPAAVVERERAKEKSWKEQRETLAAKLRVLGC